MPSPILSDPPVIPSSTLSSPPSSSLSLFSQQSLPPLDYSSSSPKASTAITPLLDTAMESSSARAGDSEAGLYRRSYGTTEKGKNDTIALDGDIGTPDSASMVSDGAQAGVKGIEAISQAWSKWSLIIAYFGVFLLASATSLEQQTTINLTAFATSSFGKHSLLATVSVVQGVVNAVVKPPMSKIANVFGRLEGFCIAILLYVCGYIQQAGSQNVQTFASAQIFYSAGSQGLQILQQIFIADTSNLVARALFVSLPDTPFLVTTWVGAPIAQSILSHSTWRWGYGLWAIVLPAAFLPLSLSLIINIRKASRLGLLPPRPWKNNTSAWQTAKQLYFDLDIMGLIILSAAIALVLLPLSFANTVSRGWHNPSMIAMVVVGCICWVAFPIWELTPKLAPKPFLSLKMLKNRNVVLGCVIGFFYFSVFYTSLQPYFYSYLQVVQFESVTAAGHVTQTFTFTSTVAAVAISVIMMFTKHFKYYIVAGAAIYLMAVGLIMRYRVAGSSVGQLVGAQIALGIGGGMINVPTLVAVQAAVAHTDVAAVTALFLTLVEIGGAVGAAISGAIWTGNLPYKLAAYLPESSKALAPEIYANLSLAISFPAGSPERDAVNQSYQETMNLLLIVALCLAAMPFILSLGLESYKLDQVDQKVKGTVLGGRVASDGHLAEDEHANANAHTTHDS